MPRPSQSSNRWRQHKEHISQQGLREANGEGGKWSKGPQGSRTDVCQLSDRVRIPDTSNSEHMPQPEFQIPW